MSDEECSSLEDFTSESKRAFNRLKSPAVTNQSRLKRTISLGKPSAAQLLGRAGSRMAEISANKKVEKSTNVIKSKSNSSVESASSTIASSLPKSSGSKLSLLSSTSSDASGGKKGSPGLAKWSDKWLIPFEHGWRREIVYRNTQTKGTKQCDIYYYAPDNFKLRSVPMIVEYINRTGCNLTSDCFSFSKQQVYKEPFEIVRNAGQCFRTSASTTSTSSSSTSIGASKGKKENSEKKIEDGINTNKRKRKNDDNTVIGNNKKINRKNSLAPTIKSETDNNDGDGAADNTASSQTSPNVEKTSSEKDNNATQQTKSPDVSRCGKNLGVFMGIESCQEKSENVDDDNSTMVLDQTLTNVKQTDVAGDDQRHSAPRNNGEETFLSSRKKRIVSETFSPVNDEPPCKRKKLDEGIENDDKIDNSEPDCTESTNTIADNDDANNSFDNNDVSIATTGNDAKDNINSEESQSETSFLTSNTNESTTEIKKNPRGRPRRIVDPNAVPVNVKKNPVGRPRLKSKDENSDGVTTTPTTSGAARTCESTSIMVTRRRVARMRNDDDGVPGIPVKSIIEVKVTSSPLSSSTPMKMTSRLFNTPDRPVYNCNETANDASKNITSVKIETSTVSQPTPSVVTITQSNEMMLLSPASSSAAMTSPSSTLMTSPSTETSSSTSTSRKISCGKKIDSKIFAVRNAANLALRAYMLNAQRIAEESFDVGDDPNEESFEANASTDSCSPSKDDNEKSADRSANDDEASAGGEEYLSGKLGTDGSLKREPDDEDDDDDDGDSTKQHSTVQNEDFVTDTPSKISTTSVTETTTTAAAATKSTNSVVERQADYSCRRDVEPSLLPTVLSEASRFVSDAKTATAAVSATTVAAPSIAAASAAATIAATTAPATHKVARQLQFKKVDQPFDRVRGPVDSHALRNIVCGPNCAGRSIPPSVRCDFCMNLYHHECLGLSFNNVRCSMICWGCQSYNRENEGVEYPMIRSVDFAVPHTTATAADVVDASNNKDYNNNRGFIRHHLQLQRNARNTNNNNSGTSPDMFEGMETGAGKDDGCDKVETQVLVINTAITKTLDIKKEFLLKVANQTIKVRPQDVYVSNTGVNIQLYNSPLPSEYIAGLDNPLKFSVVTEENVQVLNVSLLNGPV